MHNVGSIFRTADCFGAEHIHLCGFTATPPHREIHKTALGAELSLPWTKHANATDICHQLKSENYILAALEQVEGSTYLAEYSPPDGQKIALILGNETEGVSPEVLEICDVCLEIPQFGTKHSFNVSVCTGIVLWHLMK